MDRYAAAADAVLVIHALFVVFVVFGLLLVIAGAWRGWSWVRNPWFRLAHLAAIAVVVLQSWAGAVCPLTTWENALRARAGEGGYGGSFIAHWLEYLLYYQAPPWVFAACYTAFAALVLICWFRVPPRPWR
jgi:hypothetical protein